MALFGKKKDKEEKVVEKTTKAASDAQTSKKEMKKESDSTKTAAKSSKSSKVATKTSGRDLTWVLKGPRITEKGAIIAEVHNSYVFDVDTKATKQDIKEAVEAIYKVSPKKVAIVKVPSKKVQVRGQRGKHGVKSGGKKAYVYLNKGDKIEFV